jgi:hypothetical protein
MTPLERAELIDAYRVVPRLFMLLFILLGWDAYTVAQAEQTEYARDIFLAVLAATTGATGFYLSSGRKWSDK